MEIQLCYKVFELNYWGAGDEIKAIGPFCAKAEKQFIFFLVVCHQFPEDLRTNQVS